MLNRLERLLRTRDEGAWELLAQNSVLANLTSAQKQQLQMSLVAEEVAEGDVLWRAGDAPARAYLADTATITMKTPEGELKPFTSGAFVGEVDVLRSGGAAASAARVTAAGKVFAIGRDDLLRFFEDNPGVYLSFLGARFVE
jgi:CRP-like cAMP-binding protein